MAVPLTWVTKVPRYHWFIGQPFLSRLFFGGSPLTTHESELQEDSRPHDLAKTFALLGVALERNSMGSQKVLWN